MALPTLYPLEEYWSVGSTPIQTYAYNITTFGGNRQTPPPLRGSDIIIPHKVGRFALPRVIDGRTITFQMFVIGASTDGTLPTLSNPIASVPTNQRQWDINWRMLRDLFYNNGNTVSITKRYYDYSGLYGTSAPVFVAGTATAVYASGLEPTMTHRSQATFSVDMWFADPNFYNSGSGPATFF